MTSGGKNMPKEMISSTEAREQAFVLLFEKSFNEELEADKIYELALESEAIKASDFTAKLFEETCNKMPVLDDYITKYAKGWSLSRISKVSLAILRLAICEMRYFDKTPVGVSINEAVNLCKKYASEDEYTFVNGLLGTFAREECK